MQLSSLASFHGFQKPVLIYVTLREKGTQITQKPFNLKMPCLNYSCVIVVIFGIT